MEIVAIRIRDRGPVPRALKKYHRAASRKGYETAGFEFHARFTPRRFTAEHGKAAGYRPRAGQQFPYGSKMFWGSYFGRKLKGGRGRPGTDAPLVWSGTTRDRARATSLSVTANRAQLKYSLNVLNFIPWAREEFERILPREADELGQVFEGAYDTEFNRDLDEGMRFI